MFTKASAEAYFNAEKSVGLFFVVVGVATIVLAAGLFFVVKTSFWKGASVPLLLLAVLQIAAGYTVYARSDAQRKDIVYKIDLNPAGIQENEIPRMEKVMKNFARYHYVEIGLLLAGAILFFYCRKNGGQQFWAGFGIALALQATIMLVADMAAAKRGKAYLTGLKHVVAPER